MKFTSRFEEMENYIIQLQEVICTEIEYRDEKRFKEDNWERHEGGGGKTKIIEGKTFEKGGVNISKIFGKLPEQIAQQFKIEPQEFAACGLSLVLHPYSPKIPTTHMNIRYFETESGKSWFGGGIDLTPYFPHTEDFIFFHKSLKTAVNSIHPEFYGMFKPECDDYFTIKHRNEMRGIGGIFFDYLPGEDARHLELIKAAGDAFLPSYLPIVEKRKDEAFTEDDKEFQLIRRGRYVEFNLIYDRGTTFGLKTGGRIESILMSLPPEVKFKYSWNPAPGTPHFEMQNYYQPAKWDIEKME